MASESKSAPRPDRAPSARGFTLVELAMTVALLGILVAIALPKYLNYREQVRVSQSVEDIVAMSTTISGYWIDHRGYPDSLAEVGLDTKLDPWGHPYAYYNIAANGRGGARKDHALNPLNHDFDLYSMGADGVSKPQITQKDSLDDVIRAGEGAYVGLASGF